MECGQGARGDEDSGSDPFEFTSVYGALEHSPFGTGESRGADQLDVVCSAHSSSVTGSSLRREPPADSVEKRVADGGCGGMLSLDAQASFDEAPVDRLVGCRLMHGKRLRVHRSTKHVSIDW